VAALTFLGLVNRTRRECGLGSSDLTTLSGLTTEQTRFKDWINDGWVDVQLARTDWLWMRGSFSFTTTALLQNYSPSAAGATNFGEWARKTFRCYRTADGVGTEQILPFMEYDTWRNVYAYGTQRSTYTRPVVLTVNPDHSLATGPVPDDVYTISGEYQRCPVSLSADTDTLTGSVNPLPERYQMLVVYKAMKSYAVFSAAQELVDKASREERRLLQQLQIYGLPTITSGPPLA
jgi:hypothetical protein